MKRLAFWFSVFLVFGGAHLYSEVELDPYTPAYAPNVILVKFVDDAKVSIIPRGKLILTGIKSVDVLNIKYQVVSMTRVFLNAEQHEKLKMFRDWYGQLREVPKLSKIYKLQFSTNYDAKLVAEEYSRDPNIEYAEPDYYYFALETVPNDPLFTEQWYLDPFPGVNAINAWDSLTTGDTTQVIGILDTGIDWDHPDLMDKVWVNEAELNGVPGVDDDGNGYIDDVHGWDFVNNDNDPNDDNSHGTHVAGIAAATTNNSAGIAGISWGAKLIPVKVLQSSGYGSASDVASGVLYAVENGATIINLSLGSYGESQVLKQALATAYAYATIVAAAGNDRRPIEPDPPYPPFPMYPACYPWVIGVMASKQYWDDEYGWMAEFSNYDPSGPIIANNPDGYNYEIMAPGKSIISTFPNGNYHYLNGTSMSTPMVSGAIALLKTINPTISNERIFTRVIKTATNGVLDIYRLLLESLEPDLYFISYYIVDTLPNCDNDGIADAGETLHVVISIKNVGIQADSVSARLRLDEFEDTSVADIIDSTSFIGNISSYATMTNANDPFTVVIASDVMNNRDVVFQYELRCSNCNSAVTGNFVVTVQNGMEISGIYSTLHLTPDKYYIVTGNTVVETLIIEPGTVIRLDPDVSLDIIDTLHAVGTPDSMIVFTANREDAGWERIKAHFSSNDTAKMVFRYCIFEHADADYDMLYNLTYPVEDCIFRYNGLGLISLGGPIRRCVIVENESGREIFVEDNRFEFEHNVVVNNYSAYYAVIGGYAMCGYRDLVGFRNNAIFNNRNYNFYVKYAPFDIYYLPPNYWGTTDSTEIEGTILDYFEDARWPVVIGSDSALSAPPAECHGVVWKVEVNDQNPLETDVVLGVGKAKFTVYFNRTMDTTYMPFLTFGVCPPYTQHVVIDSPYWSADCKSWTAYYTVGLETGDGINTIRVANARDDEGFEIPIEDRRFKFVIQAASSEAIDFVATPGIGRVILEWPPAQIPDILGYNMYRYMAINESTFTDTTRINDTLITGTQYTDYDVIPESTYYYMYTMVGTDLAESDYSKVVSATPLNATEGDANGDMDVNVLDITTVIDYILERDPAPFIFDAADANDDGVIDVLDIIAIVNIILGGKVPQFTATDDNVELCLTADGIYIRSTANVAGLQFTIVGKLLDQIKLYPAIDGVEFSYEIHDDRVIGVLYSLDNKPLPAGICKVIKIDGYQSTLKLQNVVAGNVTGRPLSVKIVDRLMLPTRFALYQNYPNPFNNNTIIRYELPKSAKVKLIVYNIVGQIIKIFDEGTKDAGLHEVKWYGTDNNNRRLPAGVYFYRIEAKTSDGATWYSKTYKLIIMR